MSTHLLLGDARDILQSEAVPERSVDMVYCDPPFGNAQEWTGKAGSFSDRWAWGSRAAEGLAQLSVHAAWAADLVATINTETDRAYLAEIVPLLIGIRRVLRPRGTLWLHFDDTMGAWLRILCDGIFGHANALGTIIWKRTTAHNLTNSWGRTHDTIAVYGRTPAAAWKLWRLRGEFVYGDPLHREPPVGIDGYCEERLTSTSAERVGYPTQKPLALLKRFIRSGTSTGDVVLDPTCGSGTSLLAAIELDRGAIGIDRSPDAIRATQSRLAAPVQGVLF